MDLTVSFSNIVNLEGRYGDRVAVEGGPDLYGAFYLVPDDNGRVRPQDSRGKDGAVLVIDGEVYLVSLTDNGWSGTFVDYAPVPAEVAAMITSVMDEVIVRYDNDEGVQQRLAYLDQRVLEDASSELREAEKALAEAQEWVAEVTARVAAARAVLGTRTGAEATSAQAD